MTTSAIDNIVIDRIAIQTDQGQIWVSKNFSIENNQPIMGFIKIVDLDDGRIYLFNYNAVSWIGPTK